MQIWPAGARPASAANPDYFTGSVWMEEIAVPPEPARAVVLRVSFAPGARTNWHRHPLGQVLHVVAGICRIQCRGEPLREVGPGGSVWIPPGVEHWHGAAPDAVMSHIAIQERGDGGTATWLEPVSDRDYRADPA